MVQQVLLAFTKPEASYMKVLVEVSAGLLLIQLVKLSGKAKDGPGTCMSCIGLGDKDGVHDSWLLPALCMLWPFVE